LTGAAPRGYIRKREVPMKRAALAIALLLAFAAAASAQVWFPGSFDEALAKAKTENKLVIVDFYSDG
jgi:hypothetical protein